VSKLHVDGAVHGSTTMSSQKYSGASQKITEAENIPKLGIVDPDCK
jgi:hypothetical protein